MGKRADQLRRLKELREELTALSRRSVSTLTDLAKLQVRIQQLTERLGLGLSSVKGGKADANPPIDTDTGS